MPAKSKSHHYLGKRPFYTYAEPVGIQRGCPLWLLPSSSSNKSTWQLTTCVGLLACGKLRYGGADWVKKVTLESLKVAMELCESSAVTTS